MPRDAVTYRRKVVWTNWGTMEVWSAIFADLLSEETHLGDWKSRVIKEIDGGLASKWTTSIYFIFQMYFTNRTRRKKLAALARQVTKKIHSLSVLGHDCIAYKDFTVSINLGLAEADMLCVLFNTPEILPNWIEYDYSFASQKGTWVAKEKDGGKVFIHEIQDLSDNSSGDITGAY